jgi:glutamate 5-kinase
MVTKVEAASIAAGSGIHALVTSTANAAAALAGEDVGTWFSVNGARKPIRLLWLAHLASVRGTLVLDDGAVKAVRDRRTSLLPAGIAAVKGDFEAGDAAPPMSSARHWAADMTAKLFMLTTWCWSRFTRRLNWKHD